MGRNARKAVKVKQPRRSRQQQPELNEEEERLLREATIHLMLKHGGLLVATAVREETGDAAGRRWVIAVTLRYPTGHEGYVGDLLYNGKDFVFLTPPEEVTRRVQQIAADPEREREWNKYRNSTLSAGEA
jgi:hypothetical protein